MKNSVLSFKSTTCIILVFAICFLSFSGEAQTEPTIRTIEIDYNLIGNRDWSAESDMKAAPWKSGFIFRLAGYKAYHDQNGASTWPFQETKVLVGNEEFDFFDYSELESVQGYYYALLTSGTKKVFAKFHISTGAVQQQQLDIEEEVIISCFDHSRNRAFLQIKDVATYYAIDLNNLNVLKKFSCQDFEISKSGRYLGWKDYNLFEIDAENFKKSQTLLFGSADKKELASLDFFNLGSPPFGGTKFLKSNSMVDSYDLKDALYCEANRCFYAVHYSVNNFDKKSTDTLYYVEKVDLAAGSKTRVFEGEYKIEYALFSEDFRTLALYINKDKPTLNLYDRPAKTAKILAERQAIINKIYSDSVDRVRAQERLIAAAEARRIAVADSIRNAEIAAEKSKREYEEYLVKKEADRIAEEKRLAAQTIAIRNKFTVKKSMRNVNLEKYTAPTLSFSDRGLGVYAGFECNDKNDETYYYIFDKEFFTVFDTLSSTVVSYRYPYVSSDGKRDIRHYYTGFFLMLDHALGHVYIVDAYRGIVKAKYELPNLQTSLKELSIIPGKVGILYLDRLRGEQAFYSHRKDSLCYESSGLIDLKHFYTSGIQQDKLFPDFSLDHRLDRYPDELEELISRGFTFIYNINNSQVFSVKKNDFEKRDVYANTHLLANVRFEGYGGKLFGDNGHGFATTLIDRDNIPDSYVRENRDGPGFEDYFNHDNDLQLIYVKLSSWYKYHFYALDGQIIENIQGDIKSYKMQNKGLINHGIRPGGSLRFMVIRDEDGKNWLVHMSHKDVFSVQAISSESKVDLTAEQKLKIVGQITLEKETAPGKYPSNNSLRSEYVEVPKPAQPKESEIDPDKIYESYAQMVGFSESGMRIELQVRVWYKVKIEKDPIFGGTQRNRYPEAYEALKYRIPANSDKWFSSPSEITTCGFNNGTGVSSVTCIFVGGVAYRLYNPDYYD